MAQEEGPFDSKSVTSCFQDGSSIIFYPESPPMAEIDESPLQNSMDRNKESLKVKLMLRRPINQLVDQGIIPQLKTAPTIHEQRQKLERAKMGDRLKAKIQQRPDRQELVRQHILEDVGHVDPSLAERQRMLIKCRLVDSLNDQLSHRPGPLELIKKNILHTEEPIERAVKEGHIEFKATSEGQKMKPEPPDHYMTVDDDSQSSGAQSPRDENSLCGIESPCSLTTHQEPKSVIPIVDNNADIFSSSGNDLLKTAAATAGIVAVVVTPTNSILTTPNTLNMHSPLSYTKPIVVSNNDMPSFTRTSSTFTKPKSALLNQQQSAPGKEKNRKKSKTKNQQPKTRTIKFHEYKGPPSAQKNSGGSNSNKSRNSIGVKSNSETSYDLLLQQQQLFLQWQLEFKQKYPQMILPVNDAASSPLSSSSQVMDQSCDSPRPASPPPPPPLPPPPPPPLPSLANVLQVPTTNPFRNLEDMKVSDLKAELKKRNLRVSGAKTHLIERLKSYAGNNGSNANQSGMISNLVIPLNEECLSDTSVPSPLCQSVDKMDISSVPSSPQNGEISSCSDSLCMNQSEPSEVDIIREQQRKIEELQKQLLNSQLLLQQQQRQQQQRQQQAKLSQTFQSQKPVNIKANLATVLQQQQQQNNVSTKQQKLQRQNLKQQSTTNRSKSCTSDKVAASINIVAGRNVNIAPANNVNLLRNINNNIVIMNTKTGHTVTSNGGNDTLRGNTVILGDQSAAMLLNPAVIKTNGQDHRTVSLPISIPGIVGTVVQPQILISSEGGVKQLVLNSESVILPDNIKLINGTLMATASTAHVQPTTSMEMNGGTMNTSKLNDDIITAATTECLISDNNIVTLHVDQQDIDVKNEHANAYGNNDIFQALVSSSSERGNTSATQEELRRSSCQPMEQSSSDVYGHTADSSIPSNHLSLEELGIDIQSFPMDLPDNQNQSHDSSCDMMEVDNDWLEKLLMGGPCVEHGSRKIDTVNADAELMNNNDQDPLGLFGLDDSDYKSVAELSWDTIDFST